MKPLNYELRGFVTTRKPMLGREGQVKLFQLDHPNMKRGSRYLIFKPDLQRFAFTQADYLYPSLP
jgi:hypothetical protein